MGKPILIHTLEVFEQDTNCTGIWLAVKPSERIYIRELLKKYGITKVSGMPDGGAERQHSVHACIKAMNDVSIVLVHDAARPFITHPIIKELAKTAFVNGAAVAGVRAKDTMKKVVDGRVQETIDRDSLWMVQTPQAFPANLIKEAYEVEYDSKFTDDATVAENAGVPVKLIKGEDANIKITTMDDIYYASYVFGK